MSSPIGVFDSGLGGLTVVSQLMKALPNEQIIYFADNAHVPYGERPLDEIRGFALGITDFLVRKGAKAIVMACNMSSAVALDIARAKYPNLPILGMIEPGSKAAVAVADGAPIGVLATTGTVKSGAYVRVCSELDPRCVVIQQACPRFVPLVEEGRADSEEAEAAARDYLAPLLAAGCNTVILGCTHYPFLRKAIGAAVGRWVVVIDPAEETARALKNALKERGIEGDGVCEHVFYASGGTESLAAIGSAFLGRPIEGACKAEWGVDLHVTNTSAINAKS